MVNDNMFPCEWLYLEKGGDELYQVKVFQGFCIEDDMNDWLKEHKGINILNISHDSFQMDFDVYKTVAILYQETKGE